MDKTVFPGCLCVFFSFISGCTSPEKVDPVSLFIVKPYPNWTTNDRVFLKGTDANSFDGIAVKDPSIVFFDEKWHLFFTGKDADYWSIGYTTATSIEDLNMAPRTLMTSLNGGNYFAAPQVFYFEVKSKWYLIYQSGKGATFSTNTDISNPDNWSAGTTLGFGDGIDFWCIADNTRVYCFYSAQDGTGIIKSRYTSIANFPYSWSDPVTTATQTFEAPHVYRNKPDGKYYMMVEDITRHFELWQASSLGGPWKKINENWASKSNLTENGEHWTDQVSHGEIFRSGIDEKCEIENINECEVLIQGVVNGDYPSYGLIPYELGVIRNH